MKLLLSIRMSHVDSDLEEGEIPDDSPSVFIYKKSKELPRRYALRENKSSHHKHKKSCKHSVHHHAKKGKNEHKFDKKTNHRYHKSSSCKIHGNISESKTLISKNNTNLYPFAAKKKIPFENHSVCRISPESNLQTKNIHSTAKNAETMKDCSFSEMLVKYKNMRSKNLNRSVYHSNQMSHSLVKKAEGLRSIENVSLKSEILKNSCNGTLPKFLSPEREESEDEEELRRLALATCAKRSINSVKIECFSESNNQNISSRVSENKDSSLNNHFSDGEIECITSDNYEVIDMEVEEENQNAQETVEADLFVIDTKPSSGYQNNFSSVSDTAQKIQNCSEDDFEADILRAELIEQLYRQKLAADKPPTEENTSEDLYNVEKTSSQSEEQIFDENSVKILEKSKSNVDRAVSEIQANETPPRLVITLNAESSSEESEEENSGNVLNDNPVASIEALISDIRQKSDSGNKTTNEITKHIPQAVSCLSKAQQEEYNTLMKILAEKEKMLIPEEKMEIKNKIVSSSINILTEKKKMPVPSPISILTEKKEMPISIEKPEMKNKIVPSLMNIPTEKKNILFSQEKLEVKNKLIHSQINDLKILEEKYLKYQENLTKKKKLMTCLSKEVNTKKVFYMKSKLTAQHLKEKYVAAERQRRVNLNAWSKSCKNFECTKQSVSDLENKVEELRGLCSKVGSCVQGKSYSLPSVEITSEQS